MWDFGNWFLDIGDRCCPKITPVHFNSRKPLPELATIELLIQRAPLRLTTSPNNYIPYCDQSLK